MGVLKALGLATASSATFGGGDVLTLSSLPTEIGEAFGINSSTDRVTRREAMTVPAVKRGRAVIAGTIGTLPLVSMRLNGRVEDGPQTLTRLSSRLLEQPDPNTTPASLITWTVDDLIFYPMAWWRVTARGADGYPVSVERIAPWRVTITGSEVRIDGEHVADRDLIRFDGPDEGLLWYSSTLRTALLLEAAVRNYARMDVPLGTLEHKGEGPDLTPEQIDALLDRWEAQRKKRSTGYLNKSIAYKVQAFDARSSQLAEARQFMRGEIANLLSMSPRYVNAPAGDSMTYTSVPQERLELVDLTLKPFLTAINQRLSMGDVTPRGQVVAWDLSEFLRGDMKDALEASEIAVRIGARTAGEVRTELYHLPPLPAGSAPAPAPGGQA